MFCLLLCDAGVSCRQGDVPEARGALRAASDGAHEAVQVRGVQHVPPLRAVPPIHGLPPPLPGRPRHGARLQEPCGQLSRMVHFGRHYWFSVLLMFSGFIPEQDMESSRSLCFRVYLYLHFSCVICKVIADTTEIMILLESHIY